MRGPGRLIARAAATGRLAWRLGLHRCAWYAEHRIRARTGLYRASLPCGAWGDAGWAEGARSPFPRCDRASVAALADGESARAEGDRIMRGELRLFSSTWVDARGQWRANLLTGHLTDTRHWSEFGDFDAAQGDVKVIWEPSRFDWLVQLGRAHAATGERRYLDHAWRMLADWRAENPPNTGINWRCGQECALRMVAIAWAAGAFGDSLEADAVARTSAWETVGRLAERIDGAIRYSLSQHNNHGLAESMGLYLAGTCLPNHPRSTRWRSRGMRLFVRQAREQWSDDGGYNHHSMNYARLALRIGAIMALAARHAGDRLPADVERRLLAAAEFLRIHADPDDGNVPNYGANDGANLLALSSCCYGDFRPAIVFAHACLGRPSPLRPGPWDEESAWVTGAAPRESRDRSEATWPPAWHGEQSGHHVLRSAETRVFVRCHTYRNRPGHSDSLHVDVRSGRTDIAIDPGSYSYNDPGRWGYALKATAAHNTVEVDGQSQMVPFGRFLWDRWVVARQLGHGQLDSADGPILWWSGEHDGYLRLGVRHRRTILCAGGAVAVIDDLLLRPGGRETALALRWHLAPGPAWALGEASARLAAVVSHGAPLGLAVRGPGTAEARLATGESALPANGFSPRYLEIRPGALLTVVSTTRGSVRWISTWGVHGTDDRDGVAWLGAEISGEAAPGSPGRHPAGIRPMHG